MTFVQLQTEVMERLNLTSSDARNRIKRELNQRYRQVQSSVNLTKTRRGQINWTTTSGNSLVTQSGVAKLENVFDPTTLQRPLQECTVNDIRLWDAATQVVGTPYAYAVENHVNDAITLRLFPQPVATATLVSDVLLAATDLSADSDTPTFPVDYHDILVAGAMSDEYSKMEKQQPLADRYEARFQARLGDLRLFIAKSGYLHRQQTDQNTFLGLGSYVWPYSNLGN